MYPLKQEWQCNTVIICTFNSILHLMRPYLVFDSFRCWFIGSIDSKFPYLVVRLRLLLIWSFGPWWPLDKVRSFCWCNSEGFIVLVMEILYKCTLSEFGLYCRAPSTLVNLQWDSNGHRSSLHSSVHLLDHVDYNCWLIIRLQSWKTMDSIQCQ